ncbi:serine/threonine-protein kinase [Archangium sp.]|uniref:serine/threonine-protein kinase n=1 Tax=Archangium sp. TaxID=1872627 RepID=UPI00389B0C90
MESYLEDKTALRTALELPAQSLHAAGEADMEWESTVRKDILVGQRIGEYVVRRRIGSGGMGVVYEGEHPVIGRKVAIKIIRPDTSEGIRSRDLVGEARAASAIRHRGIIDIFGFGTLPGIGQYLVMEYLNGRPLDEVIMDRAPMQAAEVIRLITEVLGALSAAHAVGVIHRDLKPGNIFVVLESNGSEYVKVLDFGLAKQGATPHSATPQTRASMIVGTPEYMAPEQACGQPVSPRTDLYAVGVILFEMLTGRLPFRGDSPMHVAIQQVQAQPPRPSSLVDGLPAELEALILRLLAKEPEQRPASADAVARELKAMAKTLAAEMTQLSGFARTLPEPEPPSVRPPARQEAAAPQRGAPAPRPPVAPPETVDSPKTVLTGSRNAVAPSAPARPPPGRAPTPARPPAARPQAAAPAEVPDTAEITPVGRSSRMKLLAGVGAAVVLLGVGVGVVMSKGDSGPAVPETTPPVRGLVPIEPKPVVPQPQVQQTGTPPDPVTADPQPKTETPVPPETQPSAQAVVAGPEQTPAPQKSGPIATQDPKEPKDAAPGGKKRPPVGYLQLISECYYRVYIDDMPLRTTAVKSLALSAGPHELLLTDNPKFPPYRETIEIRAGAKRVIEAPCKTAE